MLTPASIVRHIDSRNERGLTTRLLANGRCHSQTARTLLSEPAIVHVAALSLGLQRICELSYSATSEGKALVDRLMRLQCEDGSFVAPAAPSVKDQESSRIINTALAFRALVDWASPCISGVAHRDEIDCAIERAEVGLNRLLEHNAFLDDHTAALLLWQIGGIDRARKSLPIDRIERRLANAQPEILRDDLPRLGLTMAA